MHSTSPVFDLSYCIYSGGTADIFDKLDYYLHLYHQSLSETLKLFAMNAASVYPIQTLKSEWRDYCKFGYSMALLLLKNKLKYENVENSKLTDEIIVNLEEFETGKYNKELLKVRVKGLVKHMFENDFL